MIATIVMKIRTLVYCAACGIVVTGVRVILRLRLIRRRCGRPQAEERCGRVVRRTGARQTTPRRRAELLPVTPLIVTERGGERRGIQTLSAGSERSSRSTTTTVVFRTFSALRIFRRWCPATTRPERFVPNDWLNIAESFEGLGEGGRRRARCGVDCRWRP
jgi:hypothetical protein